MTEISPARSVNLHPSIHQQHRPSKARNSCYPQAVELRSIEKSSSEAGTSNISQQMALGIIYDASHTSTLRVANPVWFTTGRLSPLAGIQMIHDRVDSAQGMSTIQLAAEVLIVGTGISRDRVVLSEASMTLSVEPLTVIVIGRHSSWLGYVELNVGRLGTTWVVHWSR